jgi:hypothetical protein
MHARRTSGTPVRPRTMLLRTASPMLLMPRKTSRKIRRVMFLMLSDLQATTTQRAPLLRDAALPNSVTTANSFSRKVRTQKRGSQCPVSGRRPTPAIALREVPAGRRRPHHNARCATPPRRIRGRNCFSGRPFCPRNMGISGDFNAGIRNLTLDNKAGKRRLVCFSSGMKVVAPIL